MENKKTIILDYDIYKDNNYTVLEEYVYSCIIEMRI